MAELLPFVWIGVGAFIGIVSFFLGFVRPVTYNAFFKLMLAVGLGMMAYGYIKDKLSQKTLQQGMEERRQHRLTPGEREIEIDIDDYKKNPNLRQEVLHRGYPKRYSDSSAQNAYQEAQQRIPPQQGGQQQAAHHYPQQQPQPQHHPSHAQRQQPAQRFCTSCGTPLLKQHKYCHICGNRV